MKGAVVYISSNREDPKFEDKVIDDMFEKKGDLPIYAVVQKQSRIQLFLQKGGIKIIGDVGTSGFNVCRQLQMAVRMSEADYVISCESDCLYSPDYFKFVPPRLDAVYRNTNNYVIPFGKDHFRMKKSQLAFQIAGRGVLLDRLDYLLDGHDLSVVPPIKWSTEMQNFPKEIGEPFLEGWEKFRTKYPCITIKTGRGMRKHTNCDNEKIGELPYWGTADQVKDKYL